MVFVPKTPLKASELNDAVDKATNVTQDGAGAVQRTVAAKAAEPISPEDFAAVGDGVVDDWQKLQRSFNAAKDHRKTARIPPRPYLVGAMLTIHSGIRVEGASRDKSVIQARAGFPTGALGVVRLGPGEPGPTLENLTIACEQPAAPGTRAGLYPYPPAVYAVGLPRFRIRHCRILGGIHGVLMTGNSGGAVLEDVEMGCYGTHVGIDGAMDSVRLDKLHIWPFGMNAEQAAIYGDSTTRGVYSGRCDDFHLSSGLIWGIRKGIEFYQSGNGATFGAINGLDLDAQGGLITSGEKTRLNWVGGVATLISGRPGS